MLRHEQESKIAAFPGAVGAVAAWAARATPGLATPGLATPGRDTPGPVAGLCGPAVAPCTWEVRAMLTVDLHCDDCADVRAFDQPPCRERHEPDCPEWACTRCGSALLIAPVLMLRRRRARVSEALAA